MWFEAEKLTIKEINSLREELATEINEKNIKSLDIVFISFNELEEE